MASYHSDVPNTDFLNGARAYDMICNIESSGAAVVGNDETQLLRGYQFLPSDQDLVDCLMKRFNDEPYPDHFHEVNLYSKHPAQLTEELGPSTDNKWYIFTPRHKKTRATKLRVDRRTPNGFWRTIGVGEDIKPEGCRKPVALKNVFDFYESNRPGGTRTEWKMHEYRLTYDFKNSLINSKPRDDMTMDNWVLCKLYKKAKRRSSEASTPTSTEAKNNEDKSSSAARNLNHEYQLMQGNFYPSRPNEGAFDDNE